MVAVASLLPDNPEEEASVLAVLREHPELRTFIQQASTKALELFPGASIQLDTVRYDAWDPPVCMRLYIPQEYEDREHGLDAFIGWVADAPGYDPDLISFLPLWKDTRARA